MLRAIGIAIKKFFNGAICCFLIFIAGFIFGDYYDTESKLVPQIIKDISKKRANFKKKDLEYYECNKKNLELIEFYESSNQLGNSDTNEEVDISFEKKEEDYRLIGYYRKKDKSNLFSYEAEKIKEGESKFILPYLKIYKIIKGDSPYRVFKKLNRTSEMNQKEISINKSYIPGDILVFKDVNNSNINLLNYIADIEVFKGKKEYDALVNVREGQCFVEGEYVIYKVGQNKSKPVIADVFGFPVEMLDNIKSLKKGSCLLMKL